MRIKMFDEGHEKDLEYAVNKFIMTIDQVVDIKYDIAVIVNGEEQIYCFSAMVIYRD